MTRSDSDALSRAKGIFTLVAFAAWGVVATYSIHAGMRPNPITLPFERPDLALTFMPQGWRFFTKNAEEPNPSVFVRSGSDWIPAFDESPYSARYLFGANRTGRYRGVEIGLVSAAVGKNGWAECGGDPLACLSELKATAIGSVRQHPALCGELGIVQQAPVPWAWARSPRPVVMPSKVARVIVSC